MTAKSQKEKPAYRQEAYDSTYLKKGNALERLGDQWGAIAVMEWSPTLSNHDALREAAENLDVNLIRYALSSLLSNLEKAAISDTARLIAEHVLETSLKNDTVLRWEAWLDAAPCWPTLARENWAEAVRQAAWLVIEALSKSGVELDETAQAELAEQVGHLEIEDLLPKALIERFFPEKPVEREW